MKLIRYKIKEWYSQNNHKGLTLLLIILLTVTIVGFLRIEYRSYNLKNLPFIDKDGLMSKVCYFGLKSIFDGDPIQEFMHEDTYRYLKSDDFHGSDIEVKKLIHIYTKKEHCKIIVQDQIGLRAFKVTLDQGPNYLFDFVISEIQEIETTKEMEDYL